MNKKQLVDLGVPVDCVPEAIACIQQAARLKGDLKPKRIIPQIVLAPEVYRANEHYGTLAEAIIEVIWAFHDA